MLGATGTVIFLLVLMSFAGVVGYQTTKSSTIAKSSPLFAVRSSRAIDEENEDLSREYVGKEVVTFITFPKRNEKDVIAQKIINLIDKIDNDEIEDLLFQIKSKSDKLKNMYLLINNRDSLIITFHNFWCVLFILIVTILSLPISILESIIDTIIENIRQTYGLCSVFPPFCP